MRISEMLQSIANWLESPNNEALLLAEYDDRSLKIVADNLVLAAELLKSAAEQVEETEPEVYHWKVFERNYEKETVEPIKEFSGTFDEAENFLKELGGKGSYRDGHFGQDGGVLIQRRPDNNISFEAIGELPSNLTSENLDHLAEIASAFDQSNDPKLQKQASVLDEILMTIGAAPDLFSVRKDLLENRITELKKKYNSNKELKEMQNSAQIEKAVDKSKMFKAKINGHPLSTRVCIEHPGAQLMRVGENVYACEVDNKLYDFANGYTLYDGTAVPGGQVELQIPDFHQEVALFDDRVGRLETNK